MEPHTENTSADNSAISPWYKSAVHAAAVGGVFSLIVLVLLVFNYVQRSVFDAKKTEELDRLKIEILGQPANEQLISRIRQLDLQVRQNRIRRLDLSHKGIYLLLGGVAVLLIGVKWAGAFRKRLPSPQPKGDNRDEQLREAMWARRAVTIGLIAIASATLLLALTPTVDFGKVGLRIAPYPSAQEIAKNWPRFRGPGGLGISAYTNVPTHWDGKTGKGILWKTEVPLPGHNSPVVWENRVFLSGANNKKRVVCCFDAYSGEPLWQRAVENIEGSGARPAKVDESTGFAASTVATDGRRVYAIFANGDIGCFDVHGKKIWARNLGTPDSPYGFASSLTTYKNLLLIQYDQGNVEDEKSNLIALSVFSGQPVWQTKRPVPSSWTSPIVTEIGQQHQIITCGDPWVIAYDPGSGAEIWRAACLHGEIAPSPVYANGLIFAVEPYAKLVAIRPDGRGDVTGTHIEWSTADSAPDICSPVSNGKMIFLLTNDGTLSSYTLKDGTRLWEQDLGADFSASPSLVGDQLYLLSEKGVMVICEVGGTYKELTRCELGEGCYASPAFADGRIYVRGVENLYCIGTQTSKNP